MNKLKIALLVIGVVFVCLVVLIGVKMVTRPDIEPSTDVLTTPPERSTESGVIEPGLVWKDTSGNVIQAHGGGFLQVGDTFYWYGEDRSSNSGCQQINCYASKDLTNWEYRGAVISKTTDPIVPLSNLERPKVIYNDKTGKFVMWVHRENPGDYRPAEAAVFVSDTPDGTFRFVKNFRPNKNMSRDCTLFKDDDGTAYFISAANENRDLKVYRLTDDYLDMKEEVATLFPGQQREAPMMFKRDGIYYLITSGCTGWTPNVQKYATATNIGGPYSTLYTLTPESKITYSTQGTYVIVVNGTNTTSYIYASDRWRSKRLSDSRYVWLPLELDPAQRKLSLAWYDKWSIDVLTGEIKTPGLAKPSENNIARKKTYRSNNFSNDTRNEYAFDGDYNTLWRAVDDSNEHYLMVDLGEDYNVTGTRVIWEYGARYRYKIEVSSDGFTWQTVSDKTASEAIAQTMEDKFKARGVRYVKISTTELDEFTTAAIREFEVFGTPIK